MARTSPPPEIEKQTKGHLLTYVNSHTSQQRMALRAQLILDWEAGLSYVESAKNDSGDWTVKPFLTWVAGSVILIIAFGLEGLAIGALWFVGMSIWFFTRLTYNN